MPIYRQPNGRYKVRWREGSRHRAKSFDRLKDARTFEAAQRREAQLGAFAASEPSSMPLADWLREWFRTGSWARSTRLDRGAIVDRWIKPFIGHVPLRELGRARVIEYRAEVVAQGATPYMANKAVTTLSAALGAAAERDLVPTNPCLGIKRLRHQVRPIEALSVEQIEAIRAEAQSNRDAALVSLMAYGGLRPEEAFGLQWRDVGESSLMIRRVFTAGELREQTKTARWRGVPILQPLAADLAELPSASPEAFVAPGHRGQPLMLRNWRERNWKAMCEEAGVTATPYQLRHSCASALIYEGRPFPEVAAFMGHGLELLMSRYAHVVDGARQREPVSYAEAAMRARTGEDVPPVFPGSDFRRESVRRESGILASVRAFLSKRATGLEPATSSLGS